MFNDCIPRIHELTREAAIVQINGILRRMGHGGGRASMRAFLTEADAFFITVNYGNDDMPDFVYVTKSSNGSVFMGWYNGDKAFPSCSFCLHGDERVGEFTNKLIDLLSHRNKTLFPEQGLCHDACSARKYLDQVGADSASELLKIAGIDVDGGHVRFDKDKGGTTVVFRSNTASNRPYEFVSIDTGKHTELSKPLRVIVHNVVGKGLDMIESDKCFDDDLTVGELIDHIRDTTTRFRSAAREL